MSEWVLWLMAASFVFWLCLRLAADLEEQSDGQWAELCAPADGDSRSDVPGSGRAERA